MCGTRSELRTNSAANPSLRSLTPNARTVRLIGSTSQVVLPIGIPCTDSTLPLADRYYDDNTAEYDISGNTCKRSQRAAFSASLAVARDKDRRRGTGDRHRVKAAVVTFARANRSCAKDGALAERRHRAACRSAFNRRASGEPPGKEACHCASELGTDRYSCVDGHWSCCGPSASRR